MFVFGSFVSNKEFPNDIDVCFDLSDVNEYELKKNYALIDRYERRRFKEYFSVHLPFFKNGDDIEMMTWMKHDRNGNEHSIVEINLKDLPIYD